MNETEMFSDHDETSPSIAAVSAPSVACSMLAVQQQRRLCRQFVDVSINEILTMATLIVIMMTTIMMTNDRWSCTSEAGFPAV